MLRKPTALRILVTFVLTVAMLGVLEAGARPARYFDFCHFNADGHRIVADLLAAALW